MKVLVISAGQDTGGQGYRIKQAFDRFEPEVQARAMHASETYIEYPGDLKYSVSVATQLMAEAEIVHAMNTLWPVFKFPHKAGVVIHHHGTRFRSDHAQMADEARSIGATQLVSTLDLAVLEPDVEWVPSPYDLGALAKLRTRRYSKGPVIRIAHAPTNREVKGTDEIISAVTRLSERYPIEFDLIEGVSWAACLKRKARADIFVDQLLLGYGNNAVEAWAMSIPVVAGVLDHSVRDRMLSEWGGLPFHEANPSNVEDRLEQLILDSPLRRALAAIGRGHVARFHDHRVVARRLKEIYAAHRGPSLTQPVPEKATPVGQGYRFIRPSAPQWGQSIT